jgi:uncharacterized protein
MLENLLEPAVLFFLLGLLAGILKTGLRLPEAIYEVLSIYLLISIGLKGGLELTKAKVDEVWLPVLGTLALGVLIPCVAYLILRYIGKLDQPNSAALAAHYGSTSAVTFAVVLSFMERQNVPYEGYTTLLLALLEIPAIAVGILIARSGKAKTEGSSDGNLWHEVFLSRSIYLLMGGLLIGFIAGPARIGAAGTFFLDPFKGVLTLFLLEMGIVTSRRLSDLRQIGGFLVAFGILMPLLSGVLGALVGTATGLSVGGTAVLATLAASASYIAAPAAVRIAIPEANPTYYLTASLGITFPFNVALGVPIYYALSQFMHTLF